MLQLTAKGDVSGFGDMLDNSASLQQLGVQHGDMVRTQHPLLLACQNCCLLGQCTTSSTQLAAPLLPCQPALQLPRLRCLPCLLAPCSHPPAQVFLLYHFERQVAPVVKKHDWEKRPFGAHMDVAAMVAAQTRIERQDSPHATSASFDFAAANAFQSYVSSAIAFSIKRGGILYGTGESGGVGWGGVGQGGGVRCCTAQRSAAQCSAVAIRQWEGAERRHASDWLPPSTHTLMLPLPMPAPAPLPCCCS